ncbi:hypothetical protein GCM10022214_52850 [Actinomadura miaoliensis]|uniref:Uncharacterized protein n=1 Tax=Actinomadura miaoliensis TaxID=430685 RepID=A0ABP7WCV1_9ACTN
MRRETEAFGQLPDGQLLARLHPYIKRHGGGVIKPSIAVTRVLDSCVLLELDGYAVFRTVVAPGRALELGRGDCRARRHRRHQPDLESARVVRSASPGHSRYAAATGMARRGALGFLRADVPSA